MLLYLLNLFWVAVRQRSVTIALLFALTVQGISVGGHLRDLFRMTGLIWPLVWILPLALVWLMAKYEPVWLPKPKFRAWLSFGLVVGSICISIALDEAEKPAKVEPSKAVTNDVRRAERDAFKRLGTK